MNTLLLVIAVAFWCMLLYYSILTIAGIHYRAKCKRDSSPQLNKYPSVAIFIPAHNEGMVIGATLDAMLQLEYPGELTIFALDNDSTDNTTEVVSDYAKAFPSIRHIVVPTGSPRGKSRVLNYGLTLTQAEYICVYDGDNRPEPQALRLLVEAAESTPHAAGAVGQVKTINEKKNILTRMIALEFSQFQLLMQAGRWAIFKSGSLTGTNMLVRRTDLLKVGAWDTYALAEDADLTISLTEQGGLLPIVPESRTWEQEPETFKVWYRQRSRWMKGNVYLVLKALKNPQWLLGRSSVHVIHLLTTYVMFVAFLVTSDIFFVLGVLGKVNTHFEIPLLLIWFESLFIYVLQLLSSIVTDSLVSGRNVLLSFVMYFTYAQFWIILLMGSWFEQLFKSRKSKVPVWDKTQRFNVDA